MRLELSFKGAPWHTLVVGADSWGNLRDYSPVIYTVLETETVLAVRGLKIWCSYDATTAELLPLMRAP